VTAFGTVVLPDRVTVGGTPFYVTTPEFVVAVMETESGALIRLTCDFYVEPHNTDQRGIEIHGDAGSVKLESYTSPLANVAVAGLDGAFENVTLVADSPGPDADWGIGLRDLVDGVIAGRDHRASGAHAAHVVEILTAIATALKEERPVAVSSDFARPLPNGWSFDASAT
jgi:predicted dehydrogenase